MKSPRGAARDGDELNLTTMVDVVFLLLIFFVWTSSFDAPETDLAGALTTLTRDRETSAAAGSRSPLDQPPPPDEIRIRVQSAATGHVSSVNGTAGVSGATLGVSGATLWQLGSARFGELNELLARMRKIQVLGDVSPVIIDAGDDVSVQTAIATLDGVRGLGFSRVAFSTGQAAVAEGP